MSAPSLPLDPSPVARALLRWFASRERSVPWRGETDAYRIWVGEIMAQQTRMAKVAERYAGFLERFPDVHALAGADLDSVMQAWEGMGYYARARNLRRAAAIVAAELGGRLPADPDGLRRLPGIGPYTAGAIASQAFGVAEPAVDGNTRRVLARLLDLADPRPASLIGAARAVLRAAPGRAGDVNQAFMDLGSRVCRPRVPLCRECPLAELCAARSAGTVDDRPARPRRRELPHREVAVAVVSRDRRILIARRPEDGLLGGLWEFPGGKLEPEETPEEAAAREVREEVGLDVRIGSPIGRVEHAFSHFRITLHAFWASCVDGSAEPAGARDCRWVLTSELDDYAFPAANRSILRTLRAGDSPRG
ncbi:MAG: A/G-specific adenine glycosylase [Gemmatimonadota bacterium]